MCNSGATFRGIESRATRRLRFIIEEALRASMIKGSTSEEVTAMLAKQFEDEVVCMETDFHAFECVLRFCMREVTEIVFARRVMTELQFTEFEQQFFEAHYCQPTAKVKLAGMKQVIEMDNMRHSGDSMTSDLNAVCNLIIVKTCDDRVRELAGMEPVAWETFLAGARVEGDDGL